MHCRMFISFPGLYSLDADNMSPVMITKRSLDIFKCHSKEQNHSHLSLGTNTLNKFSPKPVAIPTLSNKWTPWKAEVAMERWQQYFPIVVKVFFSQKHGKASLGIPPGLGRSLEKLLCLWEEKVSTQWHIGVTTVVSAMVQDWVILVLKETNLHANPLFYAWT